MLNIYVASFTYVQCSNINSMLNIKRRQFKNDIRKLQINNTLLVIWIPISGRFVWLDRVHNTVRRKNYFAQYNCLYVSNLYSQEKWYLLKPADDRFLLNVILGYIKHRINYSSVFCMWLYSLYCAFV